MNTPRTIATSLLDAVDLELSSKETQNMDFEDMEEEPRTVFHIESDDDDLTQLPSQFSSSESLDDNVEEEDTNEDASSHHQSRLIGQITDGQCTEREI